MTAVLASRQLAVGVTHPHTGIGVLLLLVALLAAVGSIALIASRRPAPLAAGLSALTVVLGVGGVVALASTRDCPASGCGSEALGAPAATPTGSPAPEVTETPAAAATTAAPTAAPTASPTPLPSASATPSPTASPTPSRTPARTPSPSPSSTPKRSATPTRTPSPTPKPAFTATVTQQPVCGSSGSTGTVGRPAVLTLSNTTSAIVSWTAAAEEALAGSGRPWATLTPDHGTLTTGGSQQVTVTPDASLCTPGDAPTTKHVQVVHDGSTITVAVTVTPMT